jgi:cellobiose phosphorylase
VARLDEILPWYAHDALIHYLAPRGLEQYSGGGWGTRDVCQGPAELLLALGRFAPLRDLLLRVFANQDPGGDWPQWFMFFERERSIRPPDSHGDIVFWPLLALGEYLIAAEDGSILETVVPFFDPAGEARAERATLWAHVERALDVMQARVIPGTHLAAYGHGDWNDSLQPADPAMLARLCSAWTVTLHHQSLATLATGLRSIGGDGAAARLQALAENVARDFARWLVPDGEIAGFAHFHEGGEVEYLLHPRDRATGIQHRLLPMIHAILAGLLGPDAARAHVATMREHLVGADGARLFDRPPAYRGGPQRHFQRGESSSFFGREIGLMYTHAHLRYAQAMARLGDAEAFFEALRRATPVALASVVPAARPRQANCYTSSSDATVADRYEALARYPEIRAGGLPLEGGWRVYSSGAGIAVRLIQECFLGLRRGRSRLAIDPVVPKQLDGLRAVIGLAGREVQVVYRIATRGYGPIAISAGGRPLPLMRLANPYRTGGASVPLALLETALEEGGDELVIDLS